MHLGCHIERIRQLQILNFCARDGLLILSSQLQSWPTRYPLCRLLSLQNLTWFSHFIPYHIIIIITWSTAQSLVFRYKDTLSSHLTLMELWELLWKLITVKTSFTNLPNFILIIFLPNSEFSFKMSKVSINMSINSLLKS